jgi:RpiB/LacA/LacB family sugar-phosphate isomerase
VKIYLGADHRGTEVAQWVLERLRGQGHTCEVKLPPDEERVDYPDYAWWIGRAVAAGAYDCGILICHTGIGMSIVANKVPGVRAARCVEPYDAEMARRHNHANVLCIGERNLSRDQIGAILDAWLEAKPEGGRHAERVAKIESPEP